MILVGNDLCVVPFFCAKCEFATSPFVCIFLQKNIEKSLFCSIIYNELILRFYIGGNIDVDERGNPYSDR